MSHYIERWECGHVASQCRCPGPKEERTRPGKCSTCAAQVSAMPERVIKAYVSKERIEVPHPNPLIATYVYDGEPRAPDEVEGWIVIAPHSEPPVPESRLLAAEARVREVEAERDVLLLEQSDREKLWQAEVDEYDAANAALRAERDALVPLAWWGLQEALGFVPEITPPTDEQITQARAILAREAGE